MSIFSKISSCRPSRRSSLIAMLLVVALIAYVAYDRLVLAPKRQRVIRRYAEFQAVVATGDATRIMEFVAPEYRGWANSRLHMYKMFATSLDTRSTVSIFSGEATICPQPNPHYLVIPGGDVIKMIEHEGEWYMGRVHID